MRGGPCELLRTTRTPPPTGIVRALSGHSLLTQSASIRNTAQPRQYRLIRTHAVTGKINMMQGSTQSRQRAGNMSAVDERPVSCTALRANTMWVPVGGTRAYKDEKYTDSDYSRVIDQMIPQLLRWTPSLLFDGEFRKKIAKKNRPQPTCSPTARSPPSWGRKKPAPGNRPQEGGKRPTGALSSLRKPAPRGRFRHPPDAAGGTPSSTRRKRAETSNDCTQRTKRDVTTCS